MRAVESVFRVEKNTLQMLSIVVHHALPDDDVPEDDPIRDLYSGIQSIQPLDCSYFNQCGCSFSVGCYPGSTFYFVRADAWKTFAMFEHLDELLQEVGLDVVLPGARDQTFDPNEEWWVVCFDSITQAALQDAHDRLDVLVEWRYQMNNKLQAVGQREIRRRVTEVKERGWETVIAELRQSEEQTRAELVSIVQGKGRDSVTT
jgi:hypothetical protein